MKTANTIDNLCIFVDQRPGLNYADYGNPTIYRRESREITADRSDFYGLLNLARRIFTDEELNEKIESNLKNSGNRLHIDESGKLIYHVGQYFPTEYRPAACRVLSSILWSYFYSIGQLTEPTIRPAKVARFRHYNLSRRILKYYFS